jgi:hypothetical protein
MTTMQFHYDTKTLYVSGTFTAGDKKITLIYGDKREGVTYRPLYGVNIHKLIVPDSVWDVFCATSIGAALIFNTVAGGVEITKGPLGYKKLRLLKLW